MKRITLFILLIFSISSMFAQEKDSTYHPAKYQIGFTPHYLFKGGIRPVFEIAQKNQKNYFQIAPVVYYVTRDQTYSGIGNNDFSKVLGAGMELNQKYFPGGMSKLVNAYVAYGIEYTFFSINSLTSNYVPVIVDGVEYLEYKDIQVQQKVNRFGTSAMFGLHFNTSTNFYIDSYIGAGFRFSDSKVDYANIEPKFNDMVWDYAYSGIIYRLGITIGLKLY